MAEAIIMPRQGQSVESCIITKWSKEVGDSVALGDLLFSYETDKAAFDEEAKAEGTLLAILAEEGDDVPVLETVGVIGKEGEDVSSFVEEATEEDTEPEAEEKPVATTATVTATAAPAAETGDRIRISPRARVSAENQNLDLAQAIPSGPNGRIIERDIIELSKKSATLVDRPAVATAAVAPPEAAYEDIPLTNVRKIIAKSMHQSLQSMAQLTNTASFDASELLAYRSKVKANADAMGLSNITLNDLVMFGVSRVLKNHPDMNAHFLDEEQSLRRFHSVNLGMAVDTDRGLLVPTLFEADKMTLDELTQAAGTIASQAQEGTISPDYLTGGTFTVSNLGIFGTESFTPVINPPQTGILGVNTIETRIKMVDGEAVPYQAMSLSLTYDHRAVDGAPAARFLQELCHSLENFSLLMAK